MNPIQAHYQAVLRPDKEGAQNQRLETFWQASFVKKGSVKIRTHEEAHRRDDADDFKSRVENTQAWRVSIEQIKAANFNLDLKKPHSSDTGLGDVDHLLPEYEKLLAQIAETRVQLKAQLMEALTRA